MNLSTMTLITGWSRSGKRKMALERARLFSRKIFLATAEAIDPEMKDRIARHQKERGESFLTVEEPVALAKALRENAAAADVILIDCLTFWLNNLLHYRLDASKEIADFLKVLEEKPTSLVLVTNEINMGVIPSDPLSRRFVEEQGRLNQEVAGRADEVILMVSGIPQILKSNFSVSPHPSLSPKGGEGGGEGVEISPHR